MPPSLAEALSAYRAGLRPAPAAAGARQRRWRLWLAGLLAGAVLVGGAVATLRPGDSSTPGALPPAAGSGPAAAPADQPDPAPPAGELNEPPSATWREWSSPVLRTWLPAIPGAGPADPDRLAGFGRTPAGALAAAATLHPVVYYLRDRAAWQRLADQRVAWADGQREQLAAALDDVWQVAGAAPVEAVPVGYRLISFSPDRAQFRLWWRFDFRDESSPVAGALVDVVWIDGDWLLFFDEPAMDMRGLQARDSYLAWGPL